MIVSSPGANAAPGKKKPSELPTTSPTIAPSASPAPTAAPNEPASDACGPILTKPDGTPWTCTLADDFDGTSLNRSIWTPQTIFASGEPTGAYACYYDDPSVVNVAGALTTIVDGQMLLVDGDAGEVRVQPE